MTYKSILIDQITACCTDKSWDLYRINEHEWEETLIRLKNVFNSWIKALEKCEESELTKVIPTY